MSLKYTNFANIPITVAAFLASSHYDFEERPEKSISATDFNKSIRQYILGQRAAAIKGSTPTDISGGIKSKMGAAIHEGIENTWKNKEVLNAALSDLGHPNGFIKRLVVNPEQPPTEDQIPVYMEVRSEIEIAGWIISGKFDCVFDGVLEDYKSTGTFNYGTGNDWKYVNQGSIYKLIHSDKITAEYMNIIWWFTDWNSSKAIKDKSYPPTPIMVHKLPLMSEMETKKFIMEFLNDVERYWNAPEEALPLCEDKHLWRTEATYKVYKDATAKRAMTGGGNFSDYFSAATFASIKGGVVKEFKATPRACMYCSAFAQCTQKDAYIVDGSLKV